jgi:hypothetical protein
MCVFSLLAFEAFVYHAIVYSSSFFIFTKSAGGVISRRLKDFLDEDSGVGITHEAGSEAENIKLSQMNILTTREDATNPLAVTEAAVSQLDTGATISAPVTPSHLL